MATSKWASRKFVVVMFSLALAFVLAMVSKLTGEFATIASVSVGAYNLSNAYLNRNQGER